MFTSWRFHGSKRNLRVTRVRHGFKSYRFLPFYRDLILGLHPHYGVYLLKSVVDRYNAPINNLITLWINTQPVLPVLVFSGVDSYRCFWFNPPQPSPPYHVQQVKWYNYIYKVEIKCITVYTCINSKFSAFHQLKMQSVLYHIWPHYIR